MSLSDYFSPTQNGDTAFTVEAPKIKFGKGALRELGQDAKALGMRRIALFTDELVAKLEPPEIALKALRQSGMEVEIFSEVEVEPTDRSFKAGAKFAQEGKFDGFVSVGGGSTIDTAKAANLYSTYPADFFAYVNAPIGKAQTVPGALKPHIACPTTFGTASECTGIAICDILELEAKSGIAHTALRPSLGILDPESLQTLPRMVLAANGFDVFSHSCESFTARPYTHRPAPPDSNKRPLSQGANPYSDLTTLESIRLIGENLVRSVESPDGDGLEALMFAGMLAGIGFGNAGCHLPHGMAYAVAGLVKDYHPQDWPQDHAMVPHGTSVIVNAPAVFRHVGPACAERHFRAAEALGADVSGASPEDGGNLLAERVIEMMKTANMPNGVSGVGYNENDLEALTERTFLQKRLNDNAPCPISREDIRKLFADAMSYW